jgi:hypothetical protein
MVPPFTIIMSQVGIGLIPRALRYPRRAVGSCHGIGFTAGSGGASAVDVDRGPRERAFRPLGSPDRGGITLPRPSRCRRAGRGSFSRARIDRAIPSPHATVAGVGAAKALDARSINGTGEARRPGASELCCPSFALNGPNREHAFRVLLPEECRMTIQGRTLHTSSNGDTWSLCRSRNGDVVVFHQPNRASGGEPSEIELSTFLEKRHQGPEHQALRQLIGELIDSSHIQAEYDDHD